MAKPPRSRVPGQGSGRNIPGGYILGRKQGAARGDVQLMSLNNLSGFGIASTTHLARAIAAVPTSIPPAFGAGAPSTLTSEGALYFNTSTTPYTLYVQHSGAWQQA